MTKQYIARQKVGRFSNGDIVGGLSEAQIKQLEADKIIEEVKPSAQTKPSKEVKTDG
ncbi:hypothetical protein J0904_05760 [Acinetobacter bereziniae]|jgi:hypothetical protein|uniref:hypothetical protein n=1 Tax=Acinetobacter TaxID=469 RepID=UPI00148F42D2|nr:MULTISPECIES: hypothetical protein [Acinetobacter]MCM8511593.1 hypothetical protein [Acinetobacter bereziniae]MDR3030106.1 hypothetical protein [Acinetobacter sp.]